MSTVGRLHVIVNPTPGSAARDLTKQVVDAGAPVVQVRVKGATDAEWAGLVEPLVEIECEFVVHGLLGQDCSVEIHEPLVQECDRASAWVGCRPAEKEDLSPSEGAQLDQSAFLVAGALAKAGYFGPFGVDAYRWVRSSGEQVLNPRGEVNARYTMGWGLLHGVFGA